MTEAKVANQITLNGKGNVMICSVKDGEREGILLRPVDDEHPIDSADPTWVDGKPYNLTDADVVIWLESLDSARVLQDRVNIVTLGLNRFKVLDA